MSPEKLALKYRALIKERMPKIETAHDETGHWYVYNGQKYGSVTKALQMLKDEGLMNWKMNRALEAFMQELTVADFKTLTLEDLDKIVERSKLAPTKEFEGAGDIGRQVHDWREQWFKRLINDINLNNEVVVTPSSESAVISGCRAIEKFKFETGYIPVACELYLANSELGIGGTLDDIGILPCPEKIPVLVNDGQAWQEGGYKIKYHPKLVLIDLKTSNIGNKTSYYLQVALYAYMFFKLTKIWPKEFYILHVSKTDGTYKLIPIKNMPQLVRDAKTLLKLKKSLDRINEEKKKEPIIV